MGGTERLVSFLDGTTRLRMVSLEGLTHHEQARRKLLLLLLLALVLNLYHLMICHAYFVLGPPSSPLRWASYFCNVSYECGGDVFSLAELEHCIIRACMTPPRQFLSKFVVPTAEYSFALRRPEPRTNFVLNCGSVSGVPGVIVFRPDAVDAQLDQMSAYYLRETVEVNLAKKVVTLPKMLSWYTNDFGSGPADVLRAVAQHADRRTGQALGTMLSATDGSTVTVRYRGFNWRCRRIELLDDEELTGLLANG
ncbi:unnamed protein product [Phaeothamnion confervicola]